MAQCDSLHKSSVTAATSLTRIKVNARHVRGLTAISSFTLSDTQCLHKKDDSSEGLWVPSWISAPC